MVSPSDARICDFIDTTTEHSFQVFLSGSLIVFGFKGFFSGFQNPTPFSNGFPIFFLVFYFTLSLIGGLSSLVGLYLSHRSFILAGIERFGMYISASAWGTYAIVNFVSPITVPSVLEFVLFFSISIGCIFRADALHRKSVAVMRVLKRSTEVGGKEKDV